MNITQPGGAALTANGVVTNINCNGANDGAIDVTVLGGTTPYTYDWSSSQAGFTNQATEDLSALGPGTYTLDVTDAAGCTLNVSYTITQPAAALSANGVVTNINCNGANDGAIDVTVLGGTTPYTYDWSSSQAGFTNQATEDLSALGPGTYTLDVTDAAGCTLNVSYTITQPAAALSANGVVTNINCNGANDGAIDVTVLGGTTPYTYDWSSSQAGFTNQATEDLSALGPGTYTLDVTDAAGCTLNVSYTITQPAAALSANGVVTNINCNGANDGAIDVTVLGGTTPYTYDWSSSQAGFTNQATEDLSALGPGTYTLDVTDAAGCTLNVSYTIIQPAAALSANGVVTNINCNGANDGAIDVTVLGGTTPYTYDWSSSQAGFTNQATEGPVGTGAGNLHP